MMAYAWADLGVWLTPFVLVGLMMVPITAVVLYRRWQGRH